MKTITIGNKTIGKGHPCFIIAEISANHNQDFNKAKRLIELAIQCGVDAVKLQTYTPDTMTLNCENDFFKIKEGPWRGQTLYELYKKAYTPWEWQADLKRYADGLGIQLISTPFDRTAVDFLESINIPAYKIASFELVDIPLIKYIASKKKPVILSTGMGSLADIELAVKTIKEQGNDNIILLKCTSDYPAIPQDMNLLNIKLLEDIFNVVPGLSDHSLFYEVAVAAVAIGAKVIEKHFTEKRSDGGPDAHFSLEAEELNNLVRSIRTTEQAVGHNHFSMTPGEMKNKMFRRSIFASNKIRQGDVFSPDNIRCVRPGNGLHPKYYEMIIGKKAKKEIKFGEPINWSQIDL